MSERYRCSLNSDRPVPSWRNVKKFMSLFAARQQQMLQNHPQLAAWARWHRRLVELDKINYEANGAPPGAIATIEQLMGWKPRKQLVRTDKMSCKRRRSSCAVGKLVDEQLGKLTAGKPVGNAHRYTRWVATNLTQRRWLPLACQVPLWADKTRTWADMIVYDVGAECFVLIELKTGYDYDYDTVREPFDENVQELQRTARNEHHLQLGWMHSIMLRTGHPLPLRSVVLRVSSKNGVAKPMPLQSLVALVYQLKFDDLPARALLDANQPADFEDESDASSLSESETELSSDSEVVVVTVVGKRKPVANSPPTSKRRRSHVHSPGQ